MKVIPEDHSNDFLGNTVTLAKIQEIGSDNRWHTIGECMDTPNKIREELSKDHYKGHDIWIRDVFGDRRYHGHIK